MECMIEGVKIKADTTLSADAVEAAVRSEILFWQAKDKQIESIDISLRNGDMLLRVKEKTS